MSVFFEQVNQPTPSAFQKRQTILTNLLDELLRPKEQQIIEAFMKPSPDEIIEQQKVGGQRIPIVMKKVETKKREEDEALEFPEPREIKPKVKKVDPNLRGPINSGTGLPAEKALEREQRVPIVWKKNDWGNKKGREENKEATNQAQNEPEQRVPIVYKGNKGNQKQHWNKDKGKHNEQEEEKKEISTSQAQTSQNEPEQRVPIVYKGNKGNQKQQHWNKDKGKHNEHKQSDIGKKEEQDEENKESFKQNSKKIINEKGGQKTTENNVEENKQKQKYKKKK
ncbi:unnamed protein product [Blepharisma stoltei]|uniref:Uncharacterized protein n=1 Tax=Blepharisma stoltei TaxID=1481888 RepID=A0AAU9JYN3_9CILI|nr:unnamed protein product [Blepharisma stoltei]